MSGHFNGLQPPLEPAEREVVKSYDGWTNFMASYGLRPYETADAEEGLAIVKGLAQSDQADAKAQSSGKGKK